MVKDVVDGLKLVADGLESVKTIADAVKSGRAYLKAKHPEVQSDLRAMLAELGKSPVLITKASAVLTSFSFAMAADVRGTELVRFNNYFIQSKVEAQLLRDQVEELRTHCSKIREHSLNISGSATVIGFAKFFGLLGLNSPERELELGERLDKLANEDFAVANSGEEMLTCLERSLEDVHNALGSGGSMYPENIPAASALLHEYRLEFEKSEARAAEAVKEIRELVKALE